MYLADIYTVTGSLAGVPGISVPCGKICGKLPVGLQIFGPAFGEARVLQLAHAFEQAEVVRAAIDRRHVRSDASIAGAREIAFFPPMTGG